AEDGGAGAARGMGERAGEREWASTREGCGWGGARSAGAASRMTRSWAGYWLVARRTTAHTAGAGRAIHDRTSPRRESLTSLGNYGREGAAEADMTDTRPGGASRPEHDSLGEVPVPAQHLSAAA